jgi:hypothetical protein
MEVKLIKDNPDGSGDFSFDCTPEEAEALLVFGIRRALEEAVKQGMEWIPPQEEQQ